MSVFRSPSPPKVHYLDDSDAAATEEERLLLTLNALEHHQAIMPLSSSTPSTPEFPSFPPSGQLPTYFSDLLNESPPSSLIIEDEKPELELKPQQQPRSREKSICEKLPVPTFPSFIQTLSPPRRELDVNLLIEKMNKFEKIVEVLETRLYTSERKILSLQRRIENKN